MANLIIPVGIPGCGKSTWAKKLLDRKYSVVSSDEIRKSFWGSLRESHDPEFKKERNERVWDVFYNTIEDHLVHNVDVFADATNLNDYARERLREIAGRTGADVHVIVFANINEALTRNYSRDEDAVVPEEVMDSMRDLFDKAWTDIEDEPYDSITTIASVK